jgi:molybdopterin biosynthesis enzyme
MISVAEARAAHAGPPQIPWRPRRFASAITPWDARCAKIVIAARDQPPFRASAMDGYAVRAERHARRAAVIGEAGAGRALHRSARPRRMRAHLHWARRCRMAPTPS